MTELVPVVLWLWVAYTLWLFRRLPGPWAATSALLGGWLLLPSASYPVSTAEFENPYWILPVCLPSPAWNSKGWLIGVGGLLGVLLFDRARFQGFRPRLCDGFVIAWFLVPLFSGTTNSLLPTDSLSNTAYRMIVWGVPYLLGRLYFATPAGARVLAIGLVAGGLFYVPLCLIESVTGPRFYAALYGFHPYETVGAERYLGYRPLVFLEDGNQLGIWLASSALTAVWLWRSGQLPAFGRLSAGWVAAMLLGVAVWSQSVGAIFLLGLGLLGLEAVQKANRGWPVAAVVVLLLALLGARAANLLDVKALARKSSAVRALAGMAAGLDRHSFAWRLTLEQRTTAVALQKPWLGWGRWDWWRAAGERPWGLAPLVLGSDGLVGLALLAGVFVAPVLRFLWLGSPRLWGTSLAPVAALAGVLAINEIDAILNPCYLTFLMAISGGLAGMPRPPRTSS